VHRLQLEITESMFAADQARVMPVLEELRAQGIHLALDDFGTGFSSLSRLKALPIDTIKIDKAFVQEKSEEGTAVIRAMLLIARAMRLEVTAEGVETELQLSTLTTLGATRLQGYLLSRPMHAALVSDWLLSQAASHRQTIDLEYSRQTGPALTGW
jgi:EAL domain-containing protein (putative c-di-GMP-specific phosphodiesterase class I)